MNLAIHLPALRTTGAGLCLALVAATGLAQPAALPEGAPATPAAASAPAAAPRGTAREVGGATRRLLALQAASGTAPRPITGDVATLSYQRYLDSFKHAIPTTSLAPPQSKTGTK